MKEDILGGLQAALSRGETLQQAMQSFYNAGYDLNEIQEAARELQTTMPQQTQQSTKQAQPVAPVSASTPKPPIQPSSTAQSPTQNPVTPQVPPPQTSPQQVPPQVQEIPTIKQDPNESKQQRQPLQVVSSYGENEFSRDISNPSTGPISTYEEKQKNPRKIIVIIIGVLLFALLLALLGIFFFREGILNFLDTVFTTQ